MQRPSFLGLNSSGAAIPHASAQFHAACTSPRLGTQNIPKSYIPETCPGAADTRTSSRIGRFSLDPSGFVC
ncbi:hypothetical protein BV22DRAFT_245946 [Leucogyrophana mollusca]|uniref:Uncharacterized protein n=1 Tax=Leucogyrophana mollusca TaxID=85980 RepID=A0ACB8BPN2_9AGAM|nr:hypothetical protein BV22DRAFT_245946 [Leucogyrophana mollusca]